MFITFPYKLVRDKCPSDKKCGVTARFVPNACECANRVSGLLKREFLPGANEVGGHDRGSHYLLSMNYTAALCGTWRYALLLQ